MKAQKQITEETKKAIQTYLSLNAKFKNAFFWSSPQRADSRRSYEKHNTFRFSNEGIELKFIVQCSAKNIYITKEVVIDGRPTNATALKKFVN
jgi:hypothetical protein